MWNPLNLLRKRVAAGPDGVRPAAIREHAVILSLHVPCGVSVEAGFTLRDALNEHKPEGWWFFNPSSFVVVFFGALDGSGRAQQCRRTVERMRTAHASLERMGIGLAHGKVMALRNENGMLAGVLGAAVNRAAKAALENAG